MTTAMPGTDTDTDIDDAFNDIVGRNPDELDDDAGDHDRFAHYAKQEDIVRAAVEGVAIVALCGKKFRPKRRPDKYPVCPTCKEILDQLPPGDDGDD